MSWFIESALGALFEESMIYWGNIGGALWRVNDLSGQHWGRSLKSPWLGQHWGRSLKSQWFIGATLGALFEESMIYWGNIGGALWRVHDWGNIGGALWRVNDLLGQHWGRSLKSQWFIGATLGALFEESMIGATLGALFEESMIYWGSIGSALWRVNDLLKTKVLINPCTYQNTMRMKRTSLLRIDEVHSKNKNEIGLWMHFKLHRIQRAKWGGHTGLTDDVWSLNPGGVTGSNFGMDVRHKG